MHLIKMYEFNELLVNVFSLSTYNNVYSVVMAKPHPKAHLYTKNWLVVLRMKSKTCSLLCSESLVPR